MQLDSETVLCAVPAWRQMNFYQAFSCSCITKCQHDKFKQTWLIIPSVL